MRFTSFVLVNVDFTAFIGSARCPGTPSASAALVGVPRSHAPGAEGPSSFFTAPHSRLRVNSPSSPVGQAPGAHVPHPLGTPTSPQEPALFLHPATSSIAIPSGFPLCLPMLSGEALRLHRRDRRENRRRWRRLAGVVSEIFPAAGSLRGRTMEPHTCTCPRHAAERDLAAR